MVYSVLHGCMIDAAIVEEQKNFRFCSCFAAVLFFFLPRTVRTVFIWRFFLHDSLLHASTDATSAAVPQRLLVVVHATLT